MPESDVSFTFDTKPFENGINTIDKGMKGLKVGAVKMASAVALGSRSPGSQGVASDGHRVRVRPGPSSAHYRRLRSPAQQAQNCA